MKNKISTLIDICSKFNYSLILSGSFADYFWLNYQDIEDFDFVTDCNFFNNFMQQNTEVMKEFIQCGIVKHKKENKWLYRYYYSGYQVDVFAKEFGEKYETIIVDGHPILISPPDARLHSLTYGYAKSKLSKEVYERKIKKVNERIESYKKLLS